MRPAGAGGSRWPAELRGAGTRDPCTPAQHRPDVPVDGLDGAEGDLLVAVVEDPVEMPRQQPAELLEGRQPLPAQGAQPGGQEPRGPALVGVGPELGELVAEQVGLGEPAVESKELAERLAV